MRGQRAWSALLEGLDMLWRCGMEASLLPSTWIIVFVYLPLVEMILRYWERSVGVCGSDADHFSHPCGVAMALCDAALVVSDFHDSRLVLLAREAESIVFARVDSVGRPGGGKGELHIHSVLQRAPLGT